MVLSRFRLFSVVCSEALRCKQGAAGTAPSN